LSDAALREELQVGSDQLRKPGEITCHNFKVPRSEVNLDFATTGYATPWGDQRGELRLSPSETPSLRSQRQDRGE
ncbi:MAG: hypothetical protein ACREV1_09915, partial [Gammaproteobacteria bacterium]